MEWLRTHLGGATLFVLGFIFGVVLRFPVFPYELAEGAATAVSAGVGAAITVLGAAWIAQGNEQRERLTAQRFIVRELRGLFALFEKLPSELDWQHQRLDTGRKASDFRLELGKLAKRFPKMEKLFERAGPDWVIAYSDILPKFEPLIAQSGELAQACSDTPDSTMPERAYRSKYQYLRGEVSEISSSIHALTPGRLR